MADGTCVRDGSRTQLSSECACISLSRHLSAVYAPWYTAVLLAADYSANQSGVTQLNIGTYYRSYISIICRVLIQVFNYYYNESARIRAEDRVLTVNFAY